MQAVPFILLDSVDQLAPDIASAATINLDAAIGNYAQVTGTTSITSMALSEGKRMLLRFTSALTLINSASLVLPRSENITTVAGDWAVFVTIGSAVYCIAYQRFTTPVTPPTNAPPLPGVYRNKKITVTGNTTFDVSCDYLWATNGAAGFSLITGLNITGASIAAAGAINQMATGLTAAAATWYYVWGVCKSDGSAAGVVVGASSTTPPALPTGYAGGFYAYMGALRTAAGLAQLMGTMQRGRRTQYVLGVAQTTASVILATGPAGTWSTTSPVLVAAPIANFVPPTATIVHLIPTANWKGTGSQVMVAPSMAYSGTNNGQSGPNGVVWIYNQNPSGDTSDQKILSVMLESTSLYWASGNANGVIACMGWDETD